MIRVALFGAKGRMGVEVANAVNAADDMTLVQEIEKGQSLQMDAYVAVDFTHPSSAVTNALSALEKNCSVVIGTSGLSEDDLKKIAAAASNSAAFYIPNFSIGAVLMMKFSSEAAKYLNTVEIIEMHHEKKADAPSGTAIRTAQMMSDSASIAAVQIDKSHIQEGARGASVNNIPVHSVRLPGLLAHQIVMLGSPGELLTIRHDSMDRKCFMPGVLLAIRACKGRTGLTVGLENLLS